MRLHSLRECAVRAGVRVNRGILLNRGCGQDSKKNPGKGGDKEQAFLGQNDTTR